MKKRLLAMLLTFAMLLTLIPAAAMADEIVAAPDVMPLDVFQYNGHSYYVYADAATWDDAAQKCENRGGYMASITSAEENTAVYNYLRSLGFKDAYFGLTDSEVEGTWKWINGEPVSYTNWHSREPNAENSREDYGMFYWKFTDGTWNDGDFGGSTVNGGVNYICEWDYVPDIPVEQALEKTGEFSFTSLIKNTMTYTYSYDESWFFNSAYTYQHDLTRMSIRAAMAAFGNENTDSESNADNIKNLMTDLGYDQIGISISYPKPSTNSIGYIISSKNIVSDDGRTISMIMVAVRGGGYHNEWGGNCNVGASGRHAGFNAAAQQVEAGIQEYLETYGNQLPYERKIWISGYSRAAATTNLVAADLDDDAVEGVHFDPENVFAFCFECPQNTPSFNSNGSHYNNITNIVNPIDLVPKVVMSGWNFTRYGKTYYTPAKSLTSFYTVYKSEMKEQYSALLWENGFYTESYADGYTFECSGQCDTFNKLCNTLCEIFADEEYGSVAGRKLYAENYQAYLVPAVENKMTGNSDGIGITDALSVMLPQIEKTAKNHIASIAIDLKYVHSAEKTIATFATHSFDHAHYPELCLSWLDSIEGNVLCSSKSKYRKAFVNCPVDVTVTDSEGNVVAAIVNDTVDEENTTLDAYIDDEGQKVIILPEDADYDIQLSATDSGEMTYTVTEYDMESQDYQRVVSYYDLPIEEGDTFTADVPEVTDDSETLTYTLTDSDGESLPADADESGDEIHEWLVSVETDGNGTATGSGTKVNGEFAEITATPDDGEEFLGWYRDDVLYSTESTLRFRATEDITLTARFTKNSPFVDVRNTDDYFYEPVLWAAANGIVYGVDDTHFAPYDTCTRAQVVTFLYRAAGEPAVTGSNPFRDVSAGEYYYDAVLWGYQNGIVYGTSDTTFSPNATVTRAQFITFLYRFAQEPTVTQRTSPFADLPANEYYTDAVLWGYQNGIVYGTDEDKFSPEDTCTRAQVVTFLHRYMTE